MSTQTFASFPGGAINAHIAAELLDIALKNVIFQQLGEKAKMPEGEGLTFQFNRYNRLNLPQATLTEGVPPNSTNMSLTTVQAVADQWGAYIALSDVAVLTIQHPLLSVAIELLGYQAAELIDREIIKMLLLSTNVTYGGAATSRAGLATASTDSLSDKVVQKMVARLRTRGARPYEGNHYVGVIDPASEQDVTQNANNAFTLASAYSNVKQLYNGELGIWRGVRWMSSNFIPTLTTVAPPAMTTPAGGSFASGNYRVVIQYTSVKTGFVEQVTDVSAAVAFALNDLLTFTTPASTDYTYSVFIGLIGGGVTGPFYQASETLSAFAQLPAGTIVQFLAPPTSGSLGTIPGALSTSIGPVHFGWVFGKQAYCVIDLQNLQTYVSAPQATTVDPLVQVRTVGWKCMWKSVIQNNDFLERFEGLSEFN